jgi:hypothetical protein
MTQIRTGGQDRFAQWGWFWQRTLRLATLLRQPHILQGAVDMVEALDRWAAVHDVEESNVGMGDAKFMRGLRYVEYPLERMR